jgi:hypothetical protein
MRDGWSLPLSKIKRNEKWMVVFVFAGAIALLVAVFQIYNLPLCPHDLTHFRGACIFEAPVPR